MYSKILSASVCLAMLSIAAAAPTTATVNSGGPIKLNDTAIPATAAVSLPLALGDRLSTNDTDAVIRFEAYGALITLATHSSIQTGESNGKPFVRLVSGALHYKLAALSNLLIFFKRSESVHTAIEGDIIIGSRRKTPIIIASSAGAAAVITTTALVKRSKSCPDGTDKTKDCGNQ